ncbi:MAG TPA: type II secretion system minor pseudopilin GspJ [Steroidobacteraceae bacterium]|nr:type II secretion system minor pseudopilin GspJ [Steroidobacteraceae bacterium]
MTAKQLRGFTLIELLVALFIAAIMFAIGYGAINQALQSRGNIRRDQRDLLQLQAAMNIMEQDFVQLAPRPVRSPDGNGYLPCLQGNPVSQSSDTSDASDSSDTSDSSNSSDTAAASDTSGGPAPLVILTRSGWSNPTGVERTELERVAYVLDNGTLVREHWNVLDATLSSVPFKRNLLEHLSSVSIRYMQPTSHGWVGVWPPSGAPIGGGPESLYYQMRPMAVEVTLDTKQWGKLTRIFEIPQ